MYSIDNGIACPVDKGKYDKEDDLQRLVANNPNLLRREWSVGRERELYLVNREQIVRISEEGNTYFLDHLLVDDEGIPVLVEVKRSSDTRIRREVVGQMIDYACGAAKWDTSQLQCMFEKNNEHLEAFDEEFWSKVSSNLKSGKMRLVFVADQIPETLRVLIEFLDKAMPNIEVYGVELKPYRNGNVELVSKTVVGNSFLSNPKPETTRMNWTYDMFSQKLEESGLSSVLNIFQEIVRYSTEDLGLSVSAGAGAVSPSIMVKTDNASLFYVYLRGRNNKGTWCSIEFSIPDLANYCRKTKEEIKSLIGNFPGVTPDMMKQLVWETNNWYHIDLGLLNKVNGLDFFKDNLKQLKELANNWSGVWEERDMIEALTEVYGNWGTVFFEQVKAVAKENGYSGRYSYNRDYIPYRFICNGEHVFNFTANKRFGSFAFNTSAIKLSKEELLRKLCDIDAQTPTYNNFEKTWITLRFNAVKENHQEKQTFELLHTLK